MPSYTPKYIIKHVVCSECGAYMTVIQTSITRHGFTVTYICNCGNTLTLVSRIHNKKDSL